MDKKIMNKSIECIKDVLKDFFINGFRHQGRWCHVCLFWGIMGIIFYQAPHLLVKKLKKSSQ